MSNQTKICRICMLATIKGVVSLFTVYDGTLQICNKVMELANIQISCEDGLPMWICYNCLVHLETSYQFKMQAEKSDKLLRKQLGITIEDDSKHMVTDNRGNQGLDNIEGHVLLPVAAEDKSDPLINNVEQNGIKITNVMSQVDSEIVNLDRESDETINRSEIGVEEVDISSITSVCTCVKGEDGIIITKCNNCIKISTDCATDDHAINDKTYQNERTINDDTFVSKDCINRMIDYIERNESCSSPIPWGTEETSQVDSIYSCTRCGDKFMPEVVGANKKPFHCHVCNEVFMFKSSLNSHLLTHKSVELGKCIICGYASHRNMLRHMLTHAVDKPFKCEVCCKAFATEKLLETHKEVHSEIKAFKCDQCDKAFVRKKGLRNHKFTHLDNKLKSKKKHECCICDKVFPCEKTAKAHLLTHTEVKAYQCSECDYTSFKSRNLKRHMVIHAEERPFTCGICAKSFSSQYSLNKHSYTHNSVKAFKCDQCDKSFVNQDALKYHKVCHTKEDTHKCKYCEKRFQYGSLLKAHEVIHTGPVKCDICSKEFVTKSGLLTHQKSRHSGMEPKCICEICGKGFMLLSLLKSHKTVHLTGDPLECDICKKKFPHARALKVHRRDVHLTSKTHQCYICGKNFKHSSSLKIHMRSSHSNSEKYNCLLCDTSFTQKSALNTHIKILHKGLEPHSCEMCGQTFKWKQTFDKHKLKCVEKK